MVPVRCGRLSCPVCLVIEAYNVAAAIALARPELCFRLSMVGDEWPVIQRRMNCLREYLRRAGYDVQWIWHIEPNPASAGHHAHGSMRCNARLNQATLSELAKKAGMGRDVYLAAIRAVLRTNTGRLIGVPAMGYGMKMAMAAPLADATALSTEQKEFLTINGRRVFHASRGFWRDDEGRALAGRRAAVTEALRLRNGPRSERWSLPMTVSEAERF